MLFSLTGVLEMRMKDFQLLKNQHSPPFVRPSGPPPGSQMPTRVISVFFFLSVLCLFFHVEKGEKNVRLPRSDIEDEADENLRAASSSVCTIISHRLKAGACSNTAAAAGRATREPLGEGDVGGGGGRSWKITAKRAPGVVALASKKKRERNKKQDFPLKQPCLAPSAQTSAQILHLHC